MTLYGYLGISRDEIAGLDTDALSALVQGKLATKIAEPQANVAPAIVRRTIDNARIAAYVLQVPELRNQYEASTAGLNDEDHKNFVRQNYDEATQSPNVSARGIQRNHIEDIRAELIRSSREINFLTANYELSDEQISSIVANLPNIDADIGSITNLYAQQTLGERSIQTTFELLRARPERAHFAIQGLLSNVELQDEQLAEIFSHAPKTEFENYDLALLVEQPLFGNQSFEAVQGTIANGPPVLSRYLAQSLINTRRLSDEDLATLIDVLPPNHNLEMLMDQITRQSDLGPTSAKSYFNKLISENLTDDELIVPLVAQRVLNGQQYAQLLIRDLDADRLTKSQREILSRAVSFPEIKEAFIAHTIDSRELNTQAFEILLGTVSFEDHEFAKLLEATNSRWQRSEAEKIFKDHGMRFGPEAVGVIIRDVEGIEFRSPHNLERLLNGTQITDGQTAALLAATVKTNEAYEMWEVIAKYGTIGDGTVSMLEQLKHSIPNLRPSFVNTLADSFHPYPIPDNYAAALLRATSETVLANELRQALVDCQQPGQETFGVLCTQFSQTQNVDKRLVQSILMKGSLSDDDVSDLIRSTANAYAGPEIRMMIVENQNLGAKSLYAMADAMRGSQNPAEEIWVVENIARKGIHPDGAQIIAGAFQHSHLADRVGQILGIGRDGQSLGPGGGFGGPSGYGGDYGNRGW